MDYLEEKFGAWQVSGDEKKGKVRFKLFLPKQVCEMILEFFIGLKNPPPPPFQRGVAGFARRKT